MFAGAFQHKILRHICNTAGIERYPGAQFDMVRLGIGLYGIDPFTYQIINNVSTLKTTILQIHEVPKEETVGYSRKGHLERDSRIAAIPIGYADGLNRRLGNGHAYCLVNGQKASYVGNICMDVCMIDVTDIDCKEGDKAIIFGDDLPVTVLSEILETIPYEILTSVSNRVKRVITRINEKKNERKRHEKDEHTLLLRIFRKLLKIDSYETYILPFVMFLFLGVVICPENE